MMSVLLGVLFSLMITCSFQPLRQAFRSEEHTSELQSQFHLVCRLLLEKKNRRYAVNDAHALGAAGRRAFLEYVPALPHPVLYRLVSYGPLLDLFLTDLRGQRGRNTFNRQTALGNDTAYWGTAQCAWLKRALFFFYSSGNHRDLHSFPTRRSSDLSGGAVVGLALVTAHPADVRTLVAHEPPVIDLLPDRDQVRAQIQDIYDTYRADGPDQAMPKRSEEHTSELQSQFHLVCRLLLEK